MSKPADREVVEQWEMQRWEKNRQGLIDVVNEGKRILPLLEDLVGSWTPAKKEAQYWKLLESISWWAPTRNRRVGETQSHYVRYCGSAVDMVYDHARLLLAMIYQLQSSK